MKLSVNTNSLLSSGQMFVLTNLLVLKKKEVMHSVDIGFISDVCTF